MLASNYPEIHAESLANLAKLWNEIPNRKPEEKKVPPQRKRSCKTSIRSVPGINSAKPAHSNRGDETVCGFA